MTRPKEVLADADGTGPKDATSPVAGWKMEAEVDLMAILYNGLPKSKRARFAERFLETPEQIAAAQKRRTQRIRAGFTVLLFVFMAVEAGAAIYIASIAETESWDTVKDWLTLSLAPLAAAGAVAAAFWFPTGGTG
jgi:hypothetical protein